MNSNYSLSEQKLSLRDFRGRCLTPVITAVGRRQTAIRHKNTNYDGGIRGAPCSKELQLVTFLYTYDHKVVWKSAYKRQ